jgi:hypothetical protein
MKKLFTLILCSVTILFARPSFGQRIRFSDTSNQWRIEYTDVHTHTDITTIQKFLGDTVVNGHQYFKLSIFYEGVYDYVRDDTFANKVYILCPVTNGYDWVLDTTEKVLYDYNLVVGDTVPAPNSPGSYYSVWDVYTTVINGLTYKVWDFKADLGNYFYQVIEGIGCLQGFGYPVQRVSNWTYYVRCFQNNGATHPLDTAVWRGNVPGYMIGAFDNFTSCGLNDVRHMNSSNKSCSVIPDPINEQGKIVLPYEISLGNLTIMNSLGQIIVNTFFENKQEISIGHLINRSGVYFYRITDSGNQSLYSGKFVAN